MKRLILLAIAAMALAIPAMATATDTRPLTPNDPGVFLCYSVFQTQPGVWPASQAAELFKGGYWHPFAVLGTVTDGTNLGGYHLTCNLATGQSVPAVHGYVGGGGYIFGSDLHDAYAPLLGLYPIVG